MNSEVGPVVVPDKRDYAGARMQWLEDRYLNSEVGKLKINSSL